MAFANVNGQKLYYEDTGGTGPTIIFSHGLMMDHEMFAPQVEALRDRYRCITWDERAHGRTAGDVIEPFSYYDSADDLAALLEYLSIDQAVLVGMSQGGFLSLRCAVTHPSIVRALILIDSKAQVEDPEETAGFLPMIETWTTHGLSDEMADYMADGSLGKDWHGNHHWKEKWRRWQPHHVKAAFQTLFDRDDFSDKLANIDVPTLVIHGEADASIPMHRAQDMVDRLPDAEMITIPGAGHASNLTHPEPANAAIERFLKTLAQ